MYVNGFIEAIDKLPQEKLRVIELPKQFNLLEFMRTFERLVRAGVTITAQIGTNCNGNKIITTSSLFLKKQKWRAIRVSLISNTFLLLYL